LGDPGYRIVYSLIAIAGMVMIVYGFGAYRASGYIPVWEPPRGMNHLAMLLVLIAFICVTAAYTPAGKIRTTLKHPMLVGVKTWALAHLLVNGDLGSMILFGSFLAWAVYDRISEKRRGDDPPEMVPGFGIGDILAVVIGAILYGLMLWLHPILIGVPVF
ncbi:MAG: NnrU family protein, partial [Hyphomicrobiales bacterium]|nr:NnrU family protein [Hyphomicrobiales bacterium]